MLSEHALNCVEFWVKRRLDAWGELRFVLKTEHKLNILSWVEEGMRSMPSGQWRAVFGRILRLRLD